MSFNYSGMPLPAYKAVETAVTHRPTATALLGIDSGDRFPDYVTQRQVESTSQNASQWDFRLFKNGSLLNGFFTRLAISEVYMPWTIPNINRRTNVMRVNLLVGGVIVPSIQTLVLPEGFYTPSQLATAVQTAVRNLPDPSAPNPNLAAFTMTYGIKTVSGTGITTVQMPVFEYSLNSPGNSINFGPITAPDSAYPYITKQTKQLFDVLGFTTFNQILSGSTTAGGITFCNFTSFIDLVATTLTNSMPLKDASSGPVSRDVVLRLYISDPSTPSFVSPSSSSFCPPGCAPFLIYRDYSSPKQIAWMPNQPVPGSIKFEWYDDNGEPLINSETSSPLQNNNSENWAVSFLVTEN